ncbi:TOMM precursor leader peptide-binding protein [Phytohabitans rumicis]|uniref:THIF-type NAD/FAD binding fold domain-containing protein n=1 Tax=Phytohabitans rumicis TaxID=1076125 RepID=A0A6V8LG64_9ACTN|nr:TOMM precursor leader peptide-binding protein [Phytohabitans rumicis]GFJ94640.1 hypothetical protein Prum_082820 [Phytohabitans rumicis]
MAEQRFVLNPYVTVVRCTDDEVLYRHGARSAYSRMLRDEGRRRVLGPVLAAFDRPRSRAETAAELADPAGATEVLDKLIDDGVLVAEDSALSAMYLQMLTGAAPTGLAAATVGVAGLGGIGGQVARQLAALGAGAVVGLDDRPVGAADQAFLRGTIGTAGEVGRPIAEAFERATVAAGFDNVTTRPQSIEDTEALADLIDEADLTVVALEAFAPGLLHRVNELAVAAEKPWLPVYADGSELVVGPLVVPGRSACYNEFEIQHESSRALRTEYLLYKEELGRRPAGDGPQLLPPFAGIAASWAVSAALPFLVDGTSFLVGRAVRIDFERLEVITERVLRLPRCPACAELRPDLRHPFL